MNKKAMNDFYDHFSVGDFVSKNELIQYMNKIYPNIKQATLEWRIYDLKNAGLLMKTKKDTFEITDRRNVVSIKMQIDNNLKNCLMEFNLFATNLKKQEPKETEVNISVWNTNFLNQYTTHQVFRNFTIIEIDEFRVESLFNQLRTKFETVIPFFKVKDLEYLIFNEKQVYVVMKLPKRSPLMNKKSQKDNYVSSPKLEKILVDLLVYKNKILPYDESEIRNIFRRLYKEYQIDKSTILNYARIRGGKIRNEVEMMIASLEDGLND